MAPNLERTTLELLALLTKQRKVRLCVGPHVHLLRLPIWALAKEVVQGHLHAPSERPGA